MDYSPLAVGYQARLLAPDCIRLVMCYVLQVMFDFFQRKELTDHRMLTFAGAVSD